MHIPRRTFLKVLAASVCIDSLFGGVSVLSGRGEANSAEEVPATEMTMEQWMEKWMKNMKAPEGTLHISRFVEAIYFLTKPIAWKPDRDQGEFEAVYVPRGFVTDFASIPRVFCSVLPSDGEYTYPAIVHDYLYWTQTRPRDVADKILRFGMQDFGIGAAKIEVIYEAVRLGGGSAWSENAKLKSQGEKRILKKFPDDPRTRWVDWKTQPDVFEL